MATKAERSLGLTKIKMPKIRDKSGEKFLMIMINYNPYFFSPYKLH
jgi:hypothetical protein